MNLRTNDIFKNVISKDESCIELCDDQIKALQQVFLEILLDISSVCDRYGIAYSLSGGTLLGAIRHKGFIPWDDDVDIDMPRKDFERFVDVFEKEFGFKYWLHIPGKTKKYGAMLARIRKIDTIYRANGDEKSEECGVFVDIFVVENTYNSKTMRKIHEILCTAALGAVSCRNFFQNRHTFLSLARGHGKILLLFRLKVFLGALIAWLPTHLVVRFADMVFSMCRNSNSENITIPAGKKKFSGELFLRSDYCVYQKADFEGHLFNIPTGYEKILSRLYGDYMRIPPPAEREKHVLLEFKL